MKHQNNLARDQLGLNYQSPIKTTFKAPGNKNLNFAIGLLIAEPVIGQCQIQRPLVHRHYPIVQTESDLEVFPRTFKEKEKQLATFLRSHLH